MTVADNRPVNLLELRATYTTGGGPDKTILLSAERHNKKIVNPIVVYLRDINDDNFQIGHMAEGKGFKYIEVLDRSKIDIRCIIELNSIVRQYNIDIIHGHDYKTDILAYILRLLNPGICLVSTAHGWITNTLMGSLYKWIHLRILKRFKHLIAVSKATKALMVSSGIKPDKVKVVYNGIDENIWRREDGLESLRNEWNIPENSFVVGTVGRIGDEKDYYTFIKIAKAVVSKANDTFFVIVGEGKEDEKEKLIQYAAELRIGSNVVFTGFRSDLIRVYSSFGIFLMTSVTKGLPNAMLEAMSMGLPVVSTNVGGIPELMVDGETGFLYDVGDVEGPAGKIMELIYDASLRNRLSVAGRERIENVFSFNNRLRIMEEYYRNLPAKV